MKTCTVVFSQNLRIESINCVKKHMKGCDKAVFLTTHQMFEYEMEKASSILDIEIENKAFIDFLSFDEMVFCDKEAYKLENNSIDRYDYEIKRLKNQIVLRNYEKINKSDVKLILCDDLGIDIKVWQENDYKYIKCAYYHYNKDSSFPRKIKNAIRNISVVNTFLAEINKKVEPLDEEVYVGTWNDRKYVFIGKMNRVGYRINISFVKSKEEAQMIHDGCFEDKKDCTYLTSLHESYRVNIPDEDSYEVFQIQDGYLPPFYSCSYRFKPCNHKYYAWDSIGKRVFNYLDLPVTIMPFRKKIYLPNPSFPNKIKNVLVVTSGSGDWTAMKNRSDEDRMVIAFVNVAKANPDINFVYRCHPVWVHPNHNGVNSINRVAEYFSRINLGNIRLSSNIPQVDENSFTVTFSRSSLEEDLKSADIVFGDHSVSMLDAGMQKTLFASVNVTKRQNLFESITELGFPHCESEDEINILLKSVCGDDFRDEYLKAIDRYNNMTDIED